MTTFHLAFPDEAAALAAFALVTAEPVATLADVPSWVRTAEGSCAIDVIGLVGADFGEVDGDGRPIVGFRVNLLLPDDAVLPEALVPAEVRPVPPLRVFG